MDGVSMNVATPVNAVAPQQMQGVMSAANGDAGFLQQLMGAMQIGDAHAFLEILGDNVTMDENLLDDMMKNNSEAMQMMMAQLMGIMSNVNFVDLENFDGNAVENVDKLGSALQNFVNAYQNSQKQNAVTENQETEKPNIEVLSVSTNSKAQKTDDNMLKTFDQNIEAARKNMGETKVKSVSKSDLQELGNFAQNTPVINEVHESKIDLSSISSKEIISQIETGIKEGIEQKNDHLVIKLHPEGLGEVTVKMTEANGKISLDIVTASQYARTALNSEIDSLKESLKQYNAEVNSLITADGSFNFGQSKGQNENEREGKHGSRENGDYVDNISYIDDVTTMEEYVRTLSEALSRYV